MFIYFNKSNLFIFLHIKKRFVHNNQFNECCEDGPRELHSCHGNSITEVSSLLRVSQLSIISKNTQLK